MRKWFVCILLVSLPCGCAEIPHAEHGQEMMLYEIKKIIFSDGLKRNIFD